MELKKRLWLLLILIAVVSAIVFALPQCSGFIYFYNRYVFYPFQSARLLVLGWIPFSIGDILYIVGGALLLRTLIMWVYYLRKFGAYKDRLAASLLNTINVALIVYIWFLVGWGINYNKPPLHESWHLFPKANEQLTDEQRKAKALSNALQFDQFLVDKLNGTAPLYRILPFKDVNIRATAYYREYTDSKVKAHGLDIKYSLFGYYLRRTAIEGYYNPFTGEGQIDGQLPAYVLPFVVCHEMAHQAGIAAEGDANLVAYAVGTAVNDPSFNYSAYLNIWFYAHNRLYRRDSVAAKRLREELNPLTKAHIDTLEQLAKKYHNEISNYSAELYDSYLKMQQQKDGIRSYANVAASAWQLEQQRRRVGKTVIKIP